MWEPRHLTTLWASTACYRDSFTFLLLFTPCCVTAQQTIMLSRDGPSSYQVVIKNCSVCVFRSVAHRQESLGFPPRDEIYCNNMCTPFCSSPHCHCHNCIHDNHQISSRGPLTQRKTDHLQIDRPLVPSRS
jgi:hypothetical protein